MDEDLTLDDIYEGLIDGKQYVLKDTLKWEWKSFCDGTLRFFVPGGFDEMHLDEEYISYNHYGSSAVTITKDNLRWLLETIFKSDPGDFTELNHHAIMDVINEGR